MNIPPGNRKYPFQWNLLGDSQVGRPNLGQMVRLEAYRLRQFTSRDVLEQHCGSEETDRVFYQAGKGERTCQFVASKVCNLNEGMDGERHSTANSGQ